jgi:hypothetical protein
LPATRTLPGDFEDNRDVHYAALAKPLDASEFIAGLRKRLDDGLTRLEQQRNGQWR